MKRLRMTCLLLMILFLTGCWDKIEIEEFAFVSVIGLDEGEYGKLRVTFQIANPQIGTSTNIQADEPSSDIITFLSEDLISSRDLASTSVARRLTFSHAKAIIVSEALAQSDKFFPMMEATQRERDIRRDINLIVCKENAAEFIRNNHPPFDIRASKYYEFIASRWQDVGFVPLSNLHRLSLRTLDNLGLFLVTYATTKPKDTKTNFESEGEFIAGQIDKLDENPLQMMGSAVFKEGKMIGKLTGDETRLSLILRPKVITNNILATFPDPLKEGEKISAKIVRGKNKIKITITDDYPIIDVTVPLILSISSIPSQIDYVTDENKQELLKTSIQKRMEELTMNLIKKTQEEFGGEPFLWSQIARRKFWLYEDFKKYNWPEKYKNAKITVKYDIKIEDFGKYNKPPKL
ncbi:MAG: Ger(x)C family spore germination protein [Epulopiscium sp.]|nr:Ger(x)C family spore germination protein [Candidatus Epulonipiscium sp.]